MTEAEFKVKLVMMKFTIGFMCGWWKDMVPQEKVGNRLCIGVGDLLGEYNERREEYCGYADGNCRVGIR